MFAMLATRFSAHRWQGGPLSQSCQRKNLALIDRLANGRGKKADGMSRGKEKGEVEKKREGKMVARERKRHEKRARNG